MKKILAIGCGGAGMFSLIVASQLKKGKFKTTILSDEADIYCRCSTPYILTKETTIKDSIQPEEMFTKFGFEIVHEKAIQIDAHKKRVRTEKGNYFDYDYLVIATGASPAVPSIEGVDVAGIYTVRTSADASNIYTAAQKARSAVVIGAGVIGLEMAGALQKMGLAVSVVEYGASLSSNMTDEEFAEKIIANLKKHQIEMFFEIKVEKIVSEDDGKKVHLNKKGAEKIIKADLVILATGIKPNIEILAGTEIATNSNGIIVDKKMRTSIKDIYACGDCCVPISAVLNENRPSPLASSAVQQAKIVGYQLAGYPISYAGSTGAFAFQILEKEYACVGLTEALAREKFSLVMTGRAQTTDLYKDLEKAQELEIKLIFAGPLMRLVGYEAFGKGVIASAEVASLAIGLKLNILKLLKFNYISHPSLTPWPFMNPIVMATEDALEKILNKVKFWKKSIH